MGFVEHYIYRLDSRHAKYVAILMVTSSTSMVIAGVLPIDEVQRTVEVVGRWDAITLFASVAIISTVFAAWMFWSFTKILAKNADAHMKTAVSLEGIHNTISSVDCVKRKRKKSGR
jgi:hypothetical protein